MKSTYALHLPLLAAVSLMAACNTNTTKQSPAGADTTKVPAFEVSSIDSTAKPCDDFDQFVNGNWKKNNPIPSTESRWGAFNVLDKENKEVRLKGIILALAEQKDLKKGTEEQQISDFYRSFLDTATIEKLGITPLQPYLDKIDGIKDLKDFAKVSGEFEMIGIPGVVNFGIDADGRNSKMNAVYQVQDGLSLGERSYYERPDSSTAEVRNEFVNHINKQFSQAGFKDADPGKTILDFETKVAKLQLTNVELRDPVATYNKAPYSELKKLAPDFDWDAFTGAQSIKTDTMILQNKKYLTSISTLLKGTSPETLKTWLRWQVLSHFASYLPKPIDDENFHFFATVMRGAKQQRPRLERAVRATDGIMGMPLGKVFAKKYFPESSKQKVSEMIENVRAVYGQRIDSLTWMSATTKEMAHKKLASFTYKIGYPDKWKDYSTIDIKPGSLIENLVSAAHYGHKEALDKIGKPVDKSEWGMTPQTVNAYYNPLNNEVVFPAGILQPPFFNADADDAINYGGIIAVIGHEFTHGFDDQGSQYDAEGNLKNWWTDADRKNFMALAQRYINYFNSIEVQKGFFIKGALTIGENIADLGGLTLAYSALEKSLKGKPEPAKIDGFNWKQRFFLGWAQVWHANSTEAALRNQILTDPHSPARERINGPLPHLKAFSDAWGCAPGSKMCLTDDKRVVIW
ncbi:M13 family metallopeptidase [Chitinophaga ginsengisoli]|uniref:Endothelin-converting enzyme n=1 Tax=Chitinophaga ginsengisoli TaxID=363837 RepID=A0A2P8FM77_9BACT|nr:M13 family metallopeptidase [Chitinophaga ginsengisoli]PSL22819.1 endothelin-converting enzyme [Chitinophaga ginsengisoli]